MSKPIAVLITDIHFTLATLERAAAAFLKAQFKAKILNVPLVVLGDTLDAKRIIAAECANKLIELLSVKDAPDTIFLVGNHDKINEKSEDHALNFLKPLATVIDAPKTGRLSGTKVLLMPYQHDTNVIKNILSEEVFFPPSLILMHQGVMGSEAGHYIQDKSACPKEWFEDFRVISGHYHKKQDIKCGRPRKGGLGLFSYLGNPYTLNFGEARDGEKGYHILNSDGSLELVSLDLPKHVVFELTADWLGQKGLVTPGAFAKEQDFLWIKVHGTSEQLASLTRTSIAESLFLQGRSFKLDLVKAEAKADIDIKSTSQDKSVILDKLIDSLTNVDDKQKKRLKATWRDFT